MGGPEAALAIGMIGSSLAGGLMAPEGQELTSFEGIPGADPAQMFGETKGLLSNYLNAMIKDAGQPVKLNTTVAPLPIFKGGALPTSISAGAVDPNRYSPSLRSTPGVEVAPTALSSVDATAPRRRTLNNGGGNNLSPEDAEAINEARRKRNLNGLPPVRPGQGYPGLGTEQQASTGGVGDDQASAAAELLSSLGEGGGMDDAFQIPDVRQPGVPRRRLTA